MTTTTTTRSQVCWRWLWLCAWLCASTAPSPAAATGGAAGLLHRRRTVASTTADPLQAAFDRGHVLGSQRQRQQQQRRGGGGGTTTRLRASDAQTAGPDDQETSDTIGINFGLGLDTPLLDSLLDRLIRRRQMLLAAAAAAYPSVNWGVTGGVGAGFFPGATGVLFPYAGGGLGVGLGGGGGLGGIGGGGGGLGGGGGFPWNRPSAYPVPVPVPAVNPYGGGGGWGSFGNGGLGGGGGGWGTFGSGFNPLFDYDNDFGFKNNNVGR